MITGADLPLTSIHGVLHRRPSLLRSTVVFSFFLLLEAEALGVEAEAVVEITASTSLIPIHIIHHFSLHFNSSKNQQNFQHMPNPKD